MPVLPSHRPPRSLRRWAWGLGALVALALGAVVGLHAFLNSDAVRGRLRARALALLEARLGPVHLGEDVLVGWRGGVQVGPLEVLATRRGAPALLTVRRVTVRPRLRALVRGDVQVGEVQLVGVRLESGKDGAGAKELLARVRRAPARAKPPATPGDDDEADGPLPRLRFDEVQVAGEVAGRRVELGPLSGRAQLTRGAGEQGLEARVDLPDGGRVSVDLTRRGDGLPEGELVLDDVALAPLARTLALPLTVTDGTLDGTLTLAPEGVARLEGKLDGLTLEGERLAKGPVGPFVLAVDGRARLDTPRRRVVLEALDLALGPHREAHVKLQGEVALAGERRFELSTRVERLPWDGALAALPEALRPGEVADGVKGSLGASFRLSGPLLDRAAWQLVGKLDLSELARDVQEGKELALAGPFVYRPLMADGRGREILIGPKDPHFTPYAELPPYLVRAVLLSEDSFFFQHAGFDFDSLREHLFAPDEEGERLRGGSTITQQLAKNLFLTRERTYARKVREAFLTLALEATLPKARLLEIYFNIIEWGPGLYGIGEAAEHYFGRRPAQLTVKEAAFLATIIPNPVRFHGYCTRNALTEVWERRVDELLVKLHEAGDLSDAQLDEARAQTLWFTHGGERPPVVVPSLPALVPASPAQP